MIIVTQEIVPDSPDIWLLVVMVFDRLHNRIRKTVGTEDLDAHGFHKIIGHFVARTFFRGTTAPAKPFGLGKGHAAQTFHVMRSQGDLIETVGLDEGLDFS